MLNALKKELLENLKAMVNTHEYIAQSLYNNMIEGVAELLCDCQAKAIQIGELVEQVEGEGTKIVHILEKYCENVYCLSQSFGKELDSQKICMNLKENLLQAQDSIINDLPTKYEVVFFPYKASMWDSLESVWKAASADSDVEAYVVPIPYYDLKPDRSFGEMHYEGELYPDYVRIFPWEKYALKDRRPDMIFIHNPYDKSNYVTSVHPDFYSSNLRKYTNMLVYIPYFVGPYEVKEEFCVLPGVIFANKVIVQSEVVKRTYIRYLGEFIKDNHYEKILTGWEQKFLALGSPKFDKVISTKADECVIPNDWQQLIKDANGNKKKIIFYNTSVAALLEGKEKMLDKIEHVLEEFKEQKDVLLMWRPHPLNWTTCETMRPELFPRYRDIVNRYRTEKWGIYDDTVDINRAIAISDAYYGDWSSLVPLYKATGKPILIQNIHSGNGE